MSLDSLVQAAAATNNNDGLKFIFVGGKGGVGKTTTSSAVASLLATRCFKKRVLLISTDPAHSLSDAWRCTFSNVPKQVPLPASNSGGTLHVMEVNPHESLQGELATWAAVSHELLDTTNVKSNNNNTNNDNNMEQSEEWESRIHQFQEWLSGIPGTDEATALSNAITHIESGQYDLIVFDTAPTGHTLKLLALPDILEQGIDKLQSWQATFWGYWQAFKAATSAGGSLSKANQRATLQQHVTEKLQAYKRDIQKVAFMLQDQQRTRFVAVCLAEFLSISETQRLLQELRKYQVICSHIVVNQLVVQDALTTQQLADLEALAEVGNLQLPADLLRRTVHACRLTTARKVIQQKYLADLQAFPETRDLRNGICQVPLLAEEVTGAQAIQRFAKLLIHNDDNSFVQAATVDGAAVSSSSTNTNVGGKLYDDLIDAKNNKTTGVDKDTQQQQQQQQQQQETPAFGPGDLIQVVGLAKSPQFNELEGKVTTHQNAETGRYGVSLVYQGKTKALALHPKNLVLVRKSDKKQKASSGSSNGNANHVPLSETHRNSNPSTPAMGEELMEKAKSILQDPEIKQLVDANPRFQAAVQDCLANPLNVMQYLGDPELSPLISKALAKM